MQVVTYRDPVSFRSAAEAHLLRDSARHGLMLGLLATLVEHPDAYPRFHLWAVEDGGRVVGAALRTEPHNIVLSQPEAAGAIEALVHALVAEGATVPGVMGGLPEADAFLAGWAAATGAVVASRMDQAIHVLERVNAIPAPAGAARRAGVDDLELVMAWRQAFADEASHGEEAADENQRRHVRRLLTEDGGGGYRLWEDGAVVCLVGFTAATVAGVRVGPVYTPPDRRGRGYATALTAHVSREILGRGVRQCLLYTDLSNPTSNAIYARIGYRRICDSAMIRFT